MSSSREQDGASTGSQGRESLLRVLHLDHSSAEGGAEYALLRMLEVPAPWAASLLVPRSADRAVGVFDRLLSGHKVSVRQAGPAQFHGAAKSNLFNVFIFGLRALGQSLAIRFSPEFRTADVVHANSSRAGVYSAVACFASRKKLVVHIRDMVDKHSLGLVGFWLFTRIALRRANGVIANSTTTLGTARPFLVARQFVAVIPSAAGLQLSDNSAAVPSSRDHGVVRVGMVARLDPWKGQDLVMRAFARVFEGSGTKLVFAGGSPFGTDAFREELNDLAQDLGIASQVEMLGHVEDVAGLISTLDICIQASLRPEPLGQNVLQYLAQGRATVAVNAGGPAEWINSGENGLLFEMGDELSLARCLRLLVEDPSLRESIAVKALKTPGLMSDTTVADLHASFFRLVSERRQNIPVRTMFSNAVSGEGHR